MNPCAVVLLVCSLWCVMGNASALGEKEHGTKPQKVEISGRVRMVGNSPMTSLVISGENREWHIAPEEEKKLLLLQQRIVTVKAQEYYYDRFFADGSPGGRFYYLKDIVIISPK